NVAVGFDNIDVAACTKRGVVATNTPGVLDETTADFAWTLLMAVARRLSEGEELARSGKWKNWDLDQLVGTDVWGKTLGIVGCGAGCLRERTFHSSRVETRECGACAAHRIGVIGDADENGVHRGGKRRRSF